MASGRHQSRPGVVALSDPYAWQPGSPFVRILAAHPNVSPITCNLVHPEGAPPSFEAPATSAPIVASSAEKDTEDATRGDEK